MSYSNHRQLAGYLRNTRNVSGYPRDTRNVFREEKRRRRHDSIFRSNASTRYLVMPRDDYDPNGNLRIIYGVVDTEGGDNEDERTLVAEYFEEVNAKNIAKKLNDDDDALGIFMAFAERIITSDIGQALLADQLGVKLTGKDAQVAASKSGELDALKKELEEKEAKKKKTTRNLMIGGGVLAAGGLTYLALRNRN